MLFPTVTGLQRRFPTLSSVGISSINDQDRCGSRCGGEVVVVVVVVVGARVVVVVVVGARVVVVVVVVVVVGARVVVVVVVEPRVVVVVVVVVGGIVVVVLSRWNSCCSRCSRFWINSIYKTSIKSILFISTS